MSISVCIYGISMFVSSELLFVNHVIVQILMMLCREYS